MSRLACRVRVSTYPGVAVVHIQGDIDAVGCSALRSDLAEVLGEPNVLLDLTGVGVIDAEGVDALLGTILSIRDQHGRVALAGAVPAVEAAVRAAAVDRLVFLTETPLAGLGWLCPPDSGISRTADPAGRGL